MEKKQTTDKLTAEKFIKTAENYFQTPLETIFKKTNKREIVQMRQTIQYFLKELHLGGLAEIGKLTGNKDHATVLHAHKTINNLCDSRYPVIVKYVNDLRNLIKSENAKILPITVKFVHNYVSQFI